MAELDRHPHNQKHSLIRRCPLTELRTVVHRGVPRGFCFHLHRDRKNMLLHLLPAIKSQTKEHLGWGWTAACPSWGTLLRGLPCKAVELEDVASVTLVWEVWSRMFLAGCWLAGWLCNFYFEKCSNLKKFANSVQWTPFIFHLASSAVDICHSSFLLSHNTSTHSIINVVIICWTALE